MCVRRLVYVCPISVNPGGKGRGIIQQSKKSYAPPGLELPILPDHGLRPWLHSFAATRLGKHATSPLRGWGTYNIAATRLGKHTTSPLRGWGTYNIAATRLGKHTTSPLRGWGTYNIAATRLGKHTTSHQR